MRESDSELMTNLFILLRKRLLSFQARIFLNIKNLRQTNATWIVKQPICFLLLMPESKYSYSKMQQPLVLTFYSTRSPEILSWKKLSSESSRVKFKNGIHSTCSSFHCFVSSEFRVLVEYFRRSIVILMHLQKMFCPTKWWYIKCSFDNK